MRKIKFVKEAYVDGEVFAKEGEIKELNDASADRWIRRGHEEVKEEIVEQKPKKKKSRKKKVEEVVEQKEEVIEIEDEDDKGESVEDVF